jgi:cytoskeleton protein RodZ
MDEIGAELREARMRLKIDINEVELGTKIRAKYLRAMENEEWDLLPGEVYVRSFLRTYADFLGLDSRHLLDEFRRRYESPSDHEPPPIVPPSRGGRERERERRRRHAIGVPPWALVVVVLVIVGVVLYVVGTHNTSHDNASLPPRTKSAHTRHHRRHKTTPAASKHASKPKPKPKTVTVALTPTGAVWVCLVNGAGKALIDGQIYDTGQTIPAETGKKLLLLLGNASVTMKVNGVSIPVAASSGPIGFRFTPGGHSALSSADDPSCSS